MASKQSAKVLSCVLKRQKAVMCLREKTHVLDQLQSGMSFSAIEHEFNANDLTIHIK